MKIVRLQAENVKRLKAVEIAPGDASLITVGGKNGQGKTSVLDSIWFALSGSDAAKLTPKPIRDGETKASVTVDIGQYVVTRNWTSNDKSYLKVENKDGATFKSPQALLDSLVGTLSFDPLAFATMEPAKQRACLMALTGLETKIMQLDKERKDIFDQRTYTGRELKLLEGQLAGLRVPEGDVPEAEVSSAEVMQEVDNALKLQRKNDAARQQVFSDGQALAKWQQDIERIRAEIAKLQQREQTLLESIKVSQKALSDKETMVAALVDPDVPALQARVNSIDQINRDVRDKKAFLAASAKYTAKKNEVDALTKRIESVDAEKKAALQNARFPIAGLNFDEHGVTLNGLPFIQLSQAEKLRVSLAMAMKLNPKLRVIRITDGSLLDSDNMALIGEMARTNDYQIWVERVDESGKVSVFIEDGEIKGGQFAQTSLV